MEKKKLNPYKDNINVPQYPKKESETKEDRAKKKKLKKKAAAKKLQKSEMDFNNVVKSINDRINEADEKGDEKKALRLEKYRDNVNKSRK